MSTTFVITRAARAKVAEQAKTGIKVKTAQEKAVADNVTDKKYTLYHRNKPVVNWDTVGILREWMMELGSGGMGTFIHYNESGRTDYNQEK